MKKLYEIKGNQNELKHKLIRLVVDNTQPASLCEARKLKEDLCATSCRIFDSLNEL